MSSEASTIQSLKAVDAWIDVINANINGGVRTAFRSSRLKFGGTNVDLQRAGTTTNLPLQIPESGLQTANTVIDFSPGAVTASTENTHFAIQGNQDRFFMVVDKGGATVMTGPNGFSGGAGQQLNPVRTGSPNGPVFLTRDGEFHWGPVEDLGDGVLANYLKDRNGLYVACAGGYWGNTASMYYDNTAPGVSNSELCRWRGVGVAAPTTEPPPIDGTSVNQIVPGVAQIRNLQSLMFSRYGSTYFTCPAPAAVDSINNPSTGTPTSFNGLQDGSVLTNSLEASNASMTQAVPELSLAQKLFSALTKILQTTQTNTDSVLNLVR